MPSLDVYIWNIVISFFVISLCLLVTVGIIKLRAWHKLDLFQRQVEDLINNHDGNNGGGSKVRIHS